MECTRDKIMQRIDQIVELRSASRYRLNAPAVYWWEGADDVSERGGGFTQDISSSGVFVLTTALPPVAARLEIDILLPGVGDGSPGVRLNGRGFVLRLQHGPTGPVGFAASVQFFQEDPDLAAVRGRGSVNRVQ
jgi:hypothetical protein